MTREEIKEVFHEVLKEHGGSCGQCCNTCELTPNEHRDHHAALRGAFSVRTQAVGAVVKLLAGGTAIWLGSAVWEYFKLKAGK
jgi:hypothetical protein